MRERPETGEAAAGEASKSQRHLIRPGREGLAAGFPIDAGRAAGGCLPSELGHTVSADNRRRVFAFCPDEDPAAVRLSLCLATIAGVPVHRAGRGS
ncbi:hypothetical protein PDE01_34630 [Paracoccus denitrificans]|nr:hypothetical protein PDE01_34630 [Paracoccus denitrificans]